MTPRKARIALVSFLGLAAAVMINLLLFQQRPMGGAGAGLRAANATSEPQRGPGYPAHLASRLSEQGRAELEGRKAEVRDWETRVPADATASKPQRSEPEMQAVRVRIAPAANEAAQLARGAIASGGDGASPDTIRAIQRELALRGYEPGPADGMAGLATRAAVMAFERDQGLAETADLDELLLQRLLLGVPAGERSAVRTPLPHGNAERVVRLVQETLSALGYAPGAPDGRFQEDTERAIREFELDNGLKPTGRISGALVTRLAKRTGQGGPVVAGRPR